MMRHLPPTFVRHSALAESCLRAVRFRDAPIDVLGPLFHARAIVQLRPAEFAEFAMAVARVRLAQGRAVRR